MINSDVLLSYPKCLISSLPLSFLVHLQVFIIVQVGITRTYFSCQKKNVCRLFCSSGVIVSYFQLLFSDVKEKNSCWLWLPFGNNQRRQLEVVAFYLWVQIWPLSLLWPSVLFLFKDCFKLLLKLFTKHFFVLLSSAFVNLWASFDVVKNPLIRQLVIGEYFKIFIISFP